MTSQKQTDASGYEGLVWGEDCFPGIDCPAPFYVGWEELQGESKDGLWESFPINCGIGESQ